MAGGVDDVDPRALIEDGRVLGHDGDALLALEVDRVHDPFGDVLVGAEGAALPQHGVDQRRLAVVDVGDDGEVAQRLAARQTWSGHCGTSFVSVSWDRGEERRPAVRVWYHA